MIYRTTSGVAVIEPGSTPRHLLSSPVTHVDWSPDGKQIVFTVETDDGGADIWLADPSGDNRKELFDCAPPCALADDPAWSPNGGEIAFWFNNDGSSKQPIRIVDAITGAVVRDLDFGPGKAPEYPRWSPDGSRLVTQLVYYERKGGKWSPVGQSIVTVAADEPTARPVVLTPMELGARQPDWSPDGARIAFDAGNPDPFSRTGSASNVWTVAADGTDLTQLTHQRDDEDWLAIVNWGKTGMLVTKINGSSYTLAALAENGTITDLTDASGEPIVGLRPRLQPGY